MINISEIKYPHLDRALMLHPGPQIVLGKEIYWTVKEDGSNIGAYIDVEGNIRFRSRNMDDAHLDMYAAMGRTDQFDSLRDLLQDAKNWNDEYVVFGELCLKGKSPTRIEVHETDHFILFDIWSVKYGGFLNYTRIHQEAYHFDLPIVDLLGTCRAIELQSLFEFKDKMLEECKNLGKEGTVAKSWEGNQHFYFKEKLDTPKIEKLPRLTQEGVALLPPLPESEIRGAVEKVRADLGDEVFRDVRKAMPLIAQYVTEEGKKHFCNPKCNLFQYYQERLREMA